MIPRDLVQVQDEEVWNLRTRLAGYPHAELTGLLFLLWVVCWENEKTTMVFQCLLYQPFKQDTLQFWVLLSSSFWYCSQQLLNV